MIEERRKTMLEIKGAVTTAICYANIIEEEAVEQIRRMCDQEFTKRSEEHTSELQSQR